MDKMNLTVTQEVTPNKVINQIIKIVNIFIFIVLASCQLMTAKRSQLENGNRTNEPMVHPQTSSPTQLPATNTAGAQLASPSAEVTGKSNESHSSGAKVNDLKPQPTNIKVPPKFGLILSGGGAKTWAHIGVLKEMQKMKIPVHAIAGVEWASVIGAVYAQNNSANEVEWELSKFKDIDDWQELIKNIFVKKSTFDLKIPFVCPSLNLKNKLNYLLNRGQLEQLVPYCLPSAGLIKPYGNSVSYLGSFEQMVAHLKATGANKIIFVNVLTVKPDKTLFGGIDSVENQFWTQYSAEILKKNINVDEVIDIDLSDFPIDNFKLRREIMVKGAEVGYPQLKKIAEKFRL